ncbi:MAG: ATP-dependent Clp protease ATP-binding subunit [Phycisphaerae bacterium]|nr:ATP-dependent Clp protease ATP-binding subunit [Phycisphaerae bacterium]
MKTIKQWVERDLSAAARKGQLEPAFEVGEAVQVVSELIEAGRNPILVGDSGIGKTAVVHEIVRQSHAGRGPMRLAGRRVLQLSLQRRLFAMRQRNEAYEDVPKLIEALHKFGRGLALFIHDIHIAYQYDLEEQLCALAYEFDGPVIGEGPERAISAMLEDTSGLRQHYTPVRLTEPSLEQTLRILQAWGRRKTERGGRVFTIDALEQPLTLTHRFLARSRLPRKAIELLDQAAARCVKGQPVTTGKVIDRFCAAHQTPQILVDPAVPLDLEELRRSFEQEILGQSQAVESIVNMIGVLKAGLSDLRRPLGVFLLVGQTGVGKTHIAQLLAKHLFGRGDRLVRINMADYPDDGDAAVLFGDPTDYREAVTRGLLTSRLIGHPFGVVLLDEFEKANPKVHDRFLQLIDEGEFVNGAGETISCRSLIFMATTNAGNEVQRGQIFGFSAGNRRNLADKVRVALEKHFRFELLNRFDGIVQFMPLSQQAIRGIAIRELEMLCRRIGIKQRGLRVMAEPSVIDWIAERGFDPNYGARILRRVIERHVTTALAGVIVRESPAPGSRIQLVLEDRTVVARVVGNPVQAETNGEVEPTIQARKAGKIRPTTAPHFS